MLAAKRTYGRQRDVTPRHSEDENEESATMTTPPTSQHSSGNILTPKSKIAAMLADLDKEDDSDEDIQMPTGQQMETTRIHPDEDFASGSPNISSSRRTLPSVAEIMQQNSDGEEQENDNETAYDRLRKRLSANSVPETLPDVPKEPIDSGRVPADPSSDDSDIELPDTTAAIRLSIAATTPRDKVQLLAERKRQLAAEDAAAQEMTVQKNKEYTASDSDSEDIEAEIRMSSAKRAPRRAATKKAIEEMHRETERIARNMTLAPSAQVKTKLKINDFLSKIGYLKTAPSPMPATQEQVTSPKQHPVAELTTQVDDDPFVVGEPEQQKSEVSPALPVCEAFAAELEESDSDIELPSVAELVTTQPVAPVVEQALVEVPHPIHEDILLDSDSDAKAEAELPERLKAHKLLFKHRDFDQASRDREIARFVAMARPDSPTKLEARAEKARRNALLAQVSKQAKAEREEREAALRAAGINVKTAVERQKEAVEVEDLVEKARRQAAELRRLEEKEDRKKKAEEDGVNGSSSEEDNDWDADAEFSDNESNDASDTDEDADTDQDEENSFKEPVKNPALARNSSILSERHLSDEDLAAPVARRPHTQRSRARRIFGDDSEEDKENASPTLLPVESEGSGLTQFFEPTQIGESAAPMHEFSATQILAGPNRHESHDMQALRDFDDSPHEEIFGEPLQANHFDRTDFVPSSQPEIDQAEPNFNATQISVFDPPSPDESVMPLPASMLPATLRSEMTQATEIDQSQIYDAHLEGVAEEEPGEHSLGRLRQGLNLDTREQPSPGPINAFKRMRQAMNEEEHRKSRKAFVDDRAVESDDEYAGLGGASDEEPDNPEEIAAELADMIDHDIQDDDEEGQRKIAAYYAQKEMENDEKMVTNLMNDINNGGLRRKRGAGLLDMDDSEDEEEEQARYKARQAQIRARLLEAQNLTTLADNPKTKAFIEALEDRPVSAQYIEIAGEEDAFDFVPETQPEGQVTESAETSSFQRTDTIADDGESQTNSQMAPPARLFKKPSKKKTLSDIRQELSFLNDDENDSQKTIEYDPSFVPSLKRERSSMDIEDRSMLSRENSQTYHDPRTSLRKEASMYSQLAAARSAESMAGRDPVTVVVSKGHQMASRMATKAVNYHAKAAQQMRAGRDKKAQQEQQKRMKHRARDAGTKSKRQDVLKLFA